jgi:hypothetical protein
MPARSHARGPIFSTEGRHINNAEMKSAIARVVESLGFECPQICSPEELGGESDD